MSTKSYNQERLEYYETRLKSYLTNLVSNPTNPHLLKAINLCHSEILLTVLLMKDDKLKPIEITFKNTKVKCSLLTKYESVSKASNALAEFITDLNYVDSFNVTAIN